jgi:hypothetical protein
MTQAPTPARWSQFNLRQVMIVTAVAAVLFALAAPTARARGWAAAFGYIGLYLLAVTFFVRVLGQLGRPG